VSSSSFLLLLLLLGIQLPIGGTPLPMHGKSPYIKRNFRKMDFELKI
jgi:hypothetical protein